MHATRWHRIWVDIKVSTWSKGPWPPPVKTRSRSCYLSPSGEGILQSGLSKNKQRPFDNAVSHHLNAATGLYLGWHQGFHVLSTCLARPQNSCYVHECMCSCVRYNMSMCIWSPLTPPVVAPLTCVCVCVCVCVCCVVFVCALCIFIL